MVAMGAASGWSNTTHDWSAGVDHEHLALIRRCPVIHAPGGLDHLVLEVLAYADDEAQFLGRVGRAVVTLLTDGSVSVADDGRGTDTRYDDKGRVIRKPVMSTRDLRFFDEPDTSILPDGYPRRGMSVVSALSRWLTHTNRRHHGSWTQRYEWGLPVTDLVAIPDDGTTGTTVHFQSDRTLISATAAGGVPRLPAHAVFAHLHIQTGRNTVIVVPR
jgi:topoisomerase-4 subunit B